MAKEILVTGASGLVGSRFVEVSKFRSNIIAPGSSELDITRSESVRGFSKKQAPDIIINFAAYTNVSEGENQRGDKSKTCWMINVDGISNIITVFGSSKTRIIQISTGYVFPGTIEDPGPYVEDHPAEKDSQKLTWYGFTKAEAERLVLRKLQSRSTIVRLVYPVRAKFGPKPDYLRKILQQFDENKLSPMFTDQRVSISYIDEICLVLDKIIEKNKFGVYHAASNDSASPFEICTYLIEKTRGATNVVRPSRLSDFLKTSAASIRYPMFSSLDVGHTTEDLGQRFLTWKDIINKLVEQEI